jgi:hypothetical protein
MPNIKLASTGGASCAESARALKRSGKSAVSPSFVPDAELGSHIVEVDLGFSAPGVEFVGECAKEQRGRWPEDPEPESFDVAGPGIVAELVDQWVVPAANVERREGRLVGRPDWLQSHRFPLWVKQARGSDYSIS